MCLLAAPRRPPYAPTHTCPGRALAGGMYLPACLDTRGCCLPATPTYTFLLFPTTPPDAGRTARRRRTYPCPAHTYLPGTHLSHSYLLPRTARTRLRKVGHTAPRGRAARGRAPPPAAGQAPLRHAFRCWVSLKDTAPILYPAWCTTPAARLHSPCLHTCHTTRGCILKPPPPPFPPLPMNTHAKHVPLLPFFIRDIWSYISARVRAFTFLPYHVYTCPPVTIPPPSAHPPQCCHAGLPRLPFQPFIMGGTYRAIARTVCSNWPRDRPGRRAWTAADGTCAGAFCLRERIKLSTFTTSLLPAPPYCLTATTARPPPRTTPSMPSPRLDAVIPSDYLRDSCWGYQRADGFPATCCGNSAWHACGLGGGRTFCCHAAGNVLGTYSAQGTDGA